jgi:hypothetical protein
MLTAALNWIVTLGRNGIHYTASIMLRYNVLSRQGIRQMEKKQSCSVKKNIALTSIEMKNSI